MPIFWPPTWRDFTEKFILVHQSITEDCINSYKEAIAIKINRYKNKIKDVYCQQNALLDTKALKRLLIINYYIIYVEANKYFLA